MSRSLRTGSGSGVASMKVPPKRKGNTPFLFELSLPQVSGLNESPSEKEGKSAPSKER